MICEKNSKSRCYKNISASIKQRNPGNMLIRCLPDFLSSNHSKCWPLFWLGRTVLCCCRIFLSLAVQNARELEWCKDLNIGKCFWSDLWFLKSLGVWVKFWYSVWLPMETSAVQFTGASLDLYPGNWEFILSHQLELGFPQLSVPEPRCQTLCLCRGPCPTGMSFLTLPWALALCWQWWSQLELHLLHIWILNVLSCTADKHLKI